MYLTDNIGVQEKSCIKTISYPQGNTNSQIPISFTIAIKLKK